jgi:hypothetical protein
MLQIKGHHKDHGEEIITDISKGHDIRKPGDNPTLRPEGWMDSEEEKIDLDQRGVDIGTEVLDQIPEKLIAQDDKQDGRKLIKENPRSPHLLSIG